ncbi:MAG: insulinase family protein [Chloracidobacterium sp.]|nr:insulinase family protein [Chloracidobacterium sp.]MDW8216740.1 pitrilysin family protein [Acidobacteriota bacterium]
MHRFSRRLLMRLVCAVGVVGVLLIPTYAQRTTAAVTPRPQDAVTEQVVAGVKTLVKRRRGSQTVAVGLFFAGGAGNANPAQAGIEALTLATATEASRRFPREALRRETARLGANLSYIVTYDYSALTLATTRQTFERGWTLFADVVRQPRFEAEDVALVRERLIAALRDDEDDPETVLQQMQAKVVYGGHPYAAAPKGTPETLARLEAADLRKHYAQLLTTKRLLLVVVGDLDAGLVAKRAAALFAGLPMGAPPPPVPSLFWTASDVTLTARPLPTDYVQGIYAAPALTSPDFPALRLAAAVLRDRVFEEVRVKRNLSYAPMAFLTAQGANVGGIYVSSVDAHQAVAVMLDEIERLRTELVEPAELRATVAQFLTTYYLAEETNSSQMATLALYELVGGGWREAFVALDRLQTVTPEQVRAAARKYMVNLRFAIVGDEKRVRPLVSRLTNGTPRD